MIDDDPLGRHRGMMPRPRTRLWYLLPIFFGILVVIAIAITPEEISKNPFQVYEINTICEVADLMLENHHSFQSYKEDFEKQFPTLWNERESISAEVQKNNGLMTDEQLTRNREIYYEMIKKYFSVNPNLKNEFALLYPNDPYVLLWLMEKHPECTPLLEEKYG